MEHIFPFGIENEDMEITEKVPPNDKYQATIELNTPMPYDESKTTTNFVVSICS